MKQINDSMEHAQHKHIFDLADRVLPGRSVHGVEVVGVGGAATGLRDCYGDVTRLMSPWYSLWVMRVHVSRSLGQRARATRARTRAL